MFKNKVHRAEQLFFVFWGFFFQLIFVGVHAISDDLTRSCALVPGFNGLNSALTLYSPPNPIASPFTHSTQFTERATEWFTYDNGIFGIETFLVTAGQQQGSSVYSLSPLQLWHYTASGSPTTNSFVLQPTFTNFFGGFDYATGVPIQQVNAIDVITIGSDIYLVSGGNFSIGGQPDQSLHLFVFRRNGPPTSGAIFHEIAPAFDVQHQAAINTVKWHEINGIFYLAVGGGKDAIDGSIYSRLYRFDPSTQSFTQINTGIAGFDIQHGTPFTFGVSVLSGDWIDANGTAYYVLSGNIVLSGGDFIWARLYEFSNVYPGELVQVKTGIAGFDVQPFNASCVQWSQNASPTYLFVGGDMLYAFDFSYPNSPILTQIPGAFDVNPFANSASWMNFDGITYLFTGGNATLGSSPCHFYRFSSNTQSFTSQPLIGQPLTVVNGVSGIIRNNVPLVAVMTTQTGSQIASLIYSSGGLIVDPYCIDADLFVAKTVNNATPVTGETIQFTITVTNRGPATATGVLLQDILPVQLSFVSSSASQGGYDSTSGIWSIGTLIANKQVTLTINAMVLASAAGMTLVNTASIVNAYGVTDPYPGQNSASVIIAVSPLVAGLGITKTANVSMAVEGQSFAYTITVSNSGPSGTPGVFVDDVLPAGVTVISSTASQGSYDTISGVWQVGPLSAGGSATLSVTVQVNNGMSGQLLLNTATIVDPYGINPYTGSITASLIIPVVSNFVPTAQLLYAVNAQGLAACSVRVQ